MAGGRTSGGAVGRIARKAAWTVVHVATGAAIGGTVFTTQGTCPFSSWISVLFLSLWGLGLSFLFRGLLETRSGCGCRACVSGSLLQHGLGKVYLGGAFLIAATVAVGPLTDAL